MASIYDIARSVIAKTPGTRVQSYLNKTLGNRHNDVDDWAWRQSPSAPTTFSNITCAIRNMPFDGKSQTHQMAVLDLLDLEPLQVAGAYQVSQGSLELVSPEARWPTRLQDVPALPGLVTLPFTAAHLVDQMLYVDDAGGFWETMKETYFTHSAHRPYDSALWKYEVAVSSALVLLFAYELRVSASTLKVVEVKPVPLAVAKGNTFMDLPHAERTASGASVALPTAATGLTATVGSGRQTRVSFHSFYAAAVVCVCFCRERKDFEPGNVAGMCRLYPHVMFTSQVPLDHVVSAIQFERPATSSVTHWHLSSASPQGERMRGTLKPLLVADSNSRPANSYALLTTVNRFAAGSGPPPVPAWDSLFSHVGSAPGTYMMVDPTKTTTRQVTAGTRLDLTSQRRVPNTFEKTPGQGAFDNIHWAPPMEFAPTYGLPAAPVVMAPLCIHDCFHMHWRWSRMDSPVANLGYSSSWTPNAVAGAPMVAPNQAVFLDLQSASAAKYVALAASTRANEWQVFCHHGAAYAVDGGLDWWLVDVAMQVPEHPLKQYLPARLKPWAMSYDHVLNYGAFGGAFPRARVATASGVTLEPVVNWVSFYYVLRYWVDPANPTAPGVERLQLSPADLSNACNT